jgi:hypothetical protein
LAGLEVAGRAGSHEVAGVVAGDVFAVGVVDVGSVAGAHVRDLDLALVTVAFEDRRTEFTPASGAAALPVVAGHGSADDLRSEHVFDLWRV